MPHATEPDQPKKLSLQEFIVIHGPQLTSSAVSEIFWPVLHEKLSNEV
jgi:hypothetical protein